MNVNIYRKIILLLVAGIFIFSGCDERETRVVIFHTNDSHSQLDHFPALAWLVNNEREKEEHVFLVSAGDIFSGNPMVDYYDPKGYPKIDLMNRAGYNVNTLGNHEFDYGLEVLADRMEQADFPFILANLNTAGSSLAQPDAFAILRAGRHRIAFLGLVQLNSQGIPSAHPDNMTGIEFFPPVETAGEYEYLTARADAVIGLTHHGFVSDTIMASRYPWFDVIIGGHSHTLTLEPEEYNGVLVTQAGSNMQYIGKVTLVFRGRELVEKSAVMIRTSGIEGADPEIAALVEMYNDNPALNRVIGRLAEPLKNKDELGIFITETYRKYGNFDFAFQNYGGIRVNSMKGDVRVRDIFRMDPFGNELVGMDLSYPELKRLIGNSLSSRNTPSVQIAGGTIEVHLAADRTVSDVKIFDLSGLELAAERKYSVAMPSYMASAFDFEREDQGTGMGIITAAVLIEHIEKNPDIGITYSTRSRIVQN